MDAEEVHSPVWLLAAMRSASKDRGRLGSPGQVRAPGRSEAVAAIRGSSDVTLSWGIGWGAGEVVGSAGGRLMAPGLLDAQPGKKAAVWGDVKRSQRGGDG